MAQGVPELNSRMTISSFRKGVFRFKGCESENVSDLSPIEVIDILKREIWKWPKSIVTPLTTLFGSTPEANKWRWIQDCHYLLELALDCGTIRERINRGEKMKNLPFKPTNRQVEVVKSALDLFEYSYQEEMEE